MPAITSTAPGKIIIFGEHAVVYGRPAIAVPVNQVRARAAIMAEPKKLPGEVFIDAPDINLKTSLTELTNSHPIKQAVLGVETSLGITKLPACTIKITSTIPVSSGMGSGAAVTVAVIRALSSFLGHPLPDEEISSLVFEVEKIHHGTPSGIDNTVITYAQPVYYLQGEPVETVFINRPITLVVGDTGISSSTADSVADVRRAWEADRARFDTYFDKIADISKNARVIIESGDPKTLGPLMDLNHELLVELGVSSPELDSLVETARKAGALGAKLSGGGRGGNMIALVPEETTSFVSNALKDSGAVRVFTTRIRNTEN
jgi:mevalonate kinase